MTHKLLWDFDIQTDHLISARRPDLIIINKKENLQIVDFAVPADHRIKLKGSVKKDKYLNLARELKKLWNMKVKIAPIMIGAFGTVTKRLLKGLEDLEVGGWWRLSKLQHYWEWPEYWEESWRLEENCCHSNPNEKPSAKTDMKNSQGVNNDNNPCNFWPSLRVPSVQKFWLWLIWLRLLVLQKIYTGFVAAGRPCY